MPAVFVHGVPETGEVWEGLREHLDGDSIALDLPGFGSPRPAGFGATKDEYAQWLAQELRGIEGPIDLVGHDWGAGLVLRVVSAPDVRLRSWAVDVAGVFAQDYVWHEFAQIWQTPEAGEAWMAAVRAAPPGSPESVSAVLASSGVPAAEAAAMAARFDATMAESILDLYRSALPNVWADWGAELVGPARGPGLVLQPTADPFDDAATSAAMAARLGARTERLDGLGHWWMLQDPKAGAAVLQDFWSSLR